MLCLFITKTCPCKKLGFTYMGGIPILLQNIDFGYSLEPPHHVATIYVLSRKIRKDKKNVIFFSYEIFNFYS